MLTDSELADLRSTQEQWMPDTVAFTAPGSGEPTYDQYTGLYEPDEGTEVYSGPCRVMATARPGLGDRVAVYGEDTVTIGDYVVTLPASAPEIPVGSIGVVSVSTDDALVDRVLIVRASAMSGYETARRVTCEVHLG